MMSTRERCGCDKPARTFKDPKFIVSKAIYYSYWDSTSERFWFLQTNTVVFTINLV